METRDIRGRKILVVEDDFSSRLYLNKLLEKTGVEIFNASNGQEAYEMAKANPGIEVILMDIQLPIIDGYTCTRMLRDEGSRIVIIAQTAYGLTGDKEKMLNSGFNDYLIKPISNNQLLEKLYLYLK